MQRFLTMTQRHVSRTDACEQAKTTITLRIITKRRRTWKPCGNETGRHSKSNAIDVHVLYTRRNAHLQRERDTTDKILRRRLYSLPPSRLAARVPICCRCCSPSPSPSRRAAGALGTFASPSRSPYSSAESPRQASSSRRPSYVRCPLSRHSRA